VHTTRGDFTADEVVLAAGAWTPELTRGLGLRVPVEAAKGYSITVERPEGHPDLPLALVEGKIFVTPMGSLLRFGGTLELAGLDMRMNRRRVDAIARTVRGYLPGIPPTPTIEIWRGLRPLTPDDLPILGRPAGTSGLIPGTGLRRADRSTRLRRNARDRPRALLPRPLLTSLVDCPISHPAGSKRAPLIGSEEPPNIGANGHPILEQKATQSGRRATLNCVLKGNQSLLEKQPKRAAGRRKY
jgi:hypothetical protein